MIRRLKDFKSLTWYRGPESNRHSREGTGF
jgi:hypothetical protein